MVNTLILQTSLDAIYLFVSFEIFTINYVASYISVILFAFFPAKLFIGKI